MKINALMVPNPITITEKASIGFGLPGCVDVDRLLCAFLDCRIIGHVDRMLIAGGRWCVLSLRVIAGVLARVGEEPRRRVGPLIEVGGVTQPAPAPRFSRTAPPPPAPPPAPGADTDAALADWGFARDEIVRLREAGAVGGG